jgi:FtsP/CotA-like multicopper oxidase with cupredoxin domain
VIYPLVAVLLVSAGVDRAPAPVLPNDNTRPAGRLDGHRLTVSLVASTGTLAAEGPHVPTHVLSAFGEEGQPLSAPGPLIRVRAGSEVAATVRNALAYDLTIHGFCEGRTTCGPVVVPAGTSRTLRVATAVPGTYAYWAAHGPEGLGDRVFADSALGGAIVVDPPGGSPPDRIFVLAILADAIDPSLSIPFIPTINGLSWPYTERLHFTVGQHVRFRVVNLSEEQHAMHLHGFHFQLQSNGDGTTDRPIPAAKRRLEVTERITQGHTFAMEWTPTRPGNWLFHCHMVGHMTPDETAPPNHDADDMREAGGMAGLVMGMTVTGAAAPATAPLLETDTATLRIAREETKNPKHPRYVIEFPGRPTPKVDEGSVPGPILVVERGRPTAVTIENRTPEPTAIHWHGIELESYYDGVAGFSGMEGSVTPPIAPGADFVARFTPPRAGTYIYHTHWHDIDQLSGGLYGPLVVLEPGERFDPAVDHVAIIGPTYVPGVAEPDVLNGRTTPLPIVFRAGVANRLRLINITANHVDIVVRLVDAGETSTWTPRAQDGAELPRTLQVAGPARTHLPVGGTFDVEVAASDPRRLWLEVRRGSGKWLLQAPVDIRK